MSAAFPVRPIRSIRERICLGLRLLIVGGALRGAALLMAALALGGCASGARPTEPSPSARATSESDCAALVSRWHGYAATAAHPRNGAGLSIRVGQSVPVTLVAISPWGGWRPSFQYFTSATKPPTGNPPARISNITGGYGAPAHPCLLTGRLIGIRPGRVTVLARTDAACFHVKPACAMPGLEWRITVTVRP
jgi:hypothetical protein